MSCRYSSFRHKNIDHSMLGYDLDCDIESSVGVGSTERVCWWQSEGELFSAFVIDPIGLRLSIAAR